MSVQWFFGDWNRSAFADAVAADAEMISDGDRGAIQLMVRAKKSRAEIGNAAGYARLVSGLRSGHRAFQIELQIRTAHEPTSAQDRPADFSRTGSGAYRPGVGPGRAPGCICPAPLGAPPKI